MSNPSTILNPIINSVYPILLDQDPELMKEKISQTKWSKQEILGHLIDSGRNILARFRQSLLQNHLVFNGYDQDESARTANYQKLEWKLLVDKWLAINQEIAELISDIPEQKLNFNTTDHNFHQICMRTILANKETSLGYLIEDYIFHLEHHLFQILPSYRKVIK